MIPMNGFRTMHPMQQQPMQQPQQPKKKKKKKQEDQKQVRMSISFKDDELWLKEELDKYSCPSATAKDILKAYFRQ